MTFAVSKGLDLESPWANGRLMQRQSVPKPSARLYGCSSKRLRCSEWRPAPTTIGPERAVTAAFVIERLARALGVDDAQAERVLYAIGDVISEKVSLGELHSLRAHLPADLRNIFPGQLDLVGRSAREDDRSVEQLER
jgi:hypothetical protein